MQSACHEAKTIGGDPKNYENRLNKNHYDRCAIGPINLSLEFEP